MLTPEECASLSQKLTMLVRKTRQVAAPTESSFHELIQDITTVLADGKVTRREALKIANSILDVISEIGGVGYGDVVKRWAEFAKLFLKECID